MSRKRKTDKIRWGEFQKKLKEQIDRREGYMQKLKEKAEKDKKENNKPILPIDMWS